MILVTGATGHIGNVLVRTLLENGERVRALVLPNEDCACLDGLDVELVKGDVLDPTSLTAAFKDVNDVYHLAGIISILPGANPTVKTVNVQGTQNVIQAARQAGIRRLVYTSSIHALQRAPHGVVIDETIPFDPVNAISVYDQSKAVASLAVQEAAGQGLDAVIVCPTGVIGPYDYRRSEMGQVILDAMQAKPQFCVDGAYDFVDVRDVANGILLANRYGKRGQSYILSGEQISVQGLINLVQHLRGIQAALLRIPMGLARFIANFTPTYYRLAKTKPRITPYSLETVSSNSVISNAKARRELGYSPRSLQESITDTIKWFMENPQLMPIKAATS